MSDKVAVVEGFFAALERGELPAAIDLVADDVDWQSPVTRAHPPEISWSSIRRSKQEVAAFFKQLGQLRCDLVRSDPLAKAFKDLQGFRQYSRALVHVFLNTATNNFQL